MDGAEELTMTVDNMGTDDTRTLPFPLLLLPSLLAGKTHVQNGFLGLNDIRLMSQVTYFNNIYFFFSLYVYVFLRLFIPLKFVAGGQGCMV